MMISDAEVHRGAVAAGDEATASNNGGTAPPPPPQKRQRRHSCSLQPPRLQPDPRRAPMRGFRGAYTRDPYALFHNFTMLAPGGRHVQANAACPPRATTNPLRQKQPVCFLSVTLARPLGTHATVAEGAVFAAATVNFLSGRIALFATVMDMYNRAPPVTEVSSHRVPVQCPHPESYLPELLALMKRGHSLLHPKCRCRHALSRERAREIGIACAADDPTRDGACKLPQQRSLWTVNELANELALVDIYYMRTTVGCFLTVADALLACKGVTVVTNDPEHWHQFAIRFGVEAIRNKADLFAYVDSRPCGGVCGHGKNTYPGFDADLQALAQAGLIYAIYNSEFKRWVGFPRYKHMENPGDDDIHSLFHSTFNATEGIHNHVGMDHALHREKLAPTREEKPHPRERNKTPKKRALPPSRAAQRPSKPRRRTRLLCSAAL